MQIQFTPKAVHEGKLIGTVEIKVPSLDERLEYMETTGLDTASEDGSINQTAKNISILRKMLPILKKKHLIKVELKDLDGAVLDSYEALQYSEAGSEVLMECAGLLLSGFKPSKN
jgi:hypothetical protein